MTRTELEHIIRAVAAITNEKELIVIGSQAILGQYPDAPKKLLISDEADIYAPARPDLSDLIDGALGELSQFETTFGYRADGVGPGTATLPRGWKDRLIPIVNENTNGATGWCLECHDIAVAKYVAGRGKDLRYIADLWDEDLIDPKTMEQRLKQTPMSDGVRRRVESRMRQDQAQHKPGRPPE